MNFLSDNQPHVFLIQPRSRKFYARAFETGETNSHPPLGLLSVAGALKRQGYGVRILDMVVEKVKLDQFIVQLHELRPALVGLTVMTETFRVAEEIAGVIKGEMPACPVVFGGAFPSFEPQTVMQNPQVDYIVRFEGEDTLVELLEHLRRPGGFPCSRIPGLVYRENGRIRKNPRRHKTERLEANPFIDPALVRLTRYTHGATITSGRGCGYDCIFCSSAAMFGRAVRARSAENLYAEVYYVHHKLGIDNFCFVDQAFTASRRRTRKFCGYVVGGDLNIKWRCMARIDGIDSDLLKLMADAGCTEVAYGVESGDPAVLEHIDKGVSLEQVELVVRQSSQVGMDVALFFILGHYADTMESMQRTVDFAVSLKNKYGVDIIPRLNTPFPGTRQYTHAAELGLTVHAGDWDDFSYAEALVSTAAFSVEDLRAAYFDFVKRVAP